ncbi:MAG: hypothetical protein OEY00_10480 [Gammaproteobacteria bacterium]|nr:hypothetical protein [Gammaproteobacteria bacterium]
MNQQQVHQHRRHKRLIDKKVQGQFLTVLVLIEVAIFAIGMFVIYQEMHAAVESNLYRVHQIADDGRPLLIMAMLMIIPWVIGINIILLIIAARIWQRNIQVIVTDLQDILSRVKQLDLRGYHIHAEHHEVLQKADRWFEVERERYHRLHVEAVDLPSGLEQISTEQTTEIRNRLITIRNILPGH